MGSTVLPVEYLHDCEAHHCSSHDTSDEANLETDCDLCDLEFAAMHPSQAEVSIKTLIWPVPQNQQISVFSPTALIQLPGLRAPPV